MSVAAPNPVPRRRLLLTEIELLGWLGRAGPGEQLTYHRGFLALDRVPIGGHLSESGAHELSRVALLAWRAAEVGIADLIQRRLGPDDFNYLIVARERKSDALATLLNMNPDRTSLPANDGALAHAA
jgi:hypothetical protein